MVFHGAANTLDIEMWSYGGAPFAVRALCPRWAPPVGKVGYF